MKKIIVFLLTFLISCNTENDDNILTPESNQWVFVACEGNFGASNGSITMINNLGDIKSINDLGDIVQSIEVYKNKLFVIINNSHKIIAFDITKDGLRLPGIEIDTNESSPREMKILNEKLYFTNWNSSDIKILNLNNYVIENSIKVHGKPESIEFDGSNLWVGIQLNDDYSDGNRLLKINPYTNLISESFEIGKGPTSISFKDNAIYVANTFYDAQYNAFYGSSKLSLIDNKIDINNYGPGIVCGGDVLNYNNNIFRSFDGGVAMLGDDLKILEQTKIGSNVPSQLYSSKVIGEYVYFGITDFQEINQVKVYDSNNTEVASYEVGIIPGDFAFWESN